MIGRFIVLNTIGVGLLFAAYLTGVLQVLWAADKFLAIPIIGTLTLIGLCMLGQATILQASYHYTLERQDRFRRRVEGALWLADKLPVVGLALTVIGLLWAANGDIEGVEFKRDIIHALVGNFMGVAAYAWLEFNARVCR